MVNATVAIELVPVMTKENGRVFSETVLWSPSLLPNGQSCAGTTKHGRGHYGSFDRRSVKHYNNPWRSTSTSALKTRGISKMSERELAPQEGHRSEKLILLRPRKEIPWTEPLMVLRFSILCTSACSSLLT